MLEEGEYSLNLRQLNSSLPRSGQSQNPSHWSLTRKQSLSSVHGAWSSRHWPAGN